MSGALAACGTLLPLASALPVAAQSGSRLPQPINRRVGVWLTNSPSPLYYDPVRIEARQCAISPVLIILRPAFAPRGDAGHRGSFGPAPRPMR